MPNESVMQLWGILWIVLALIFSLWVMLYWVFKIADNLQKQVDKLKEGRRNGSRQAGKG